MIKKLTVAITILTLPLLFFWPAILGEITLSPGDGWSQNMGIRILTGQLLRSGQLPLWNPYLFAGMPLLANIQAGVLYPPNWLFAVFPPQAAMNLLIITTYHIALAGTYLYARRIGLTRIGSMVAAVVFAFGGFMVAHLGHTNMIATGAWLGWNLLAMEELYRSFRWRWVGLGAFFMSMPFLTGAPQITLYLTLVVFAYGLFSSTLRPVGEQRRRFLLGLIAVTVIGVLISMAQLIPTRELQQLTERASIDYAFFAQCSLPHKQIYGMFLPYYLGGGARPYGLPYWGECNMTEYAGYVGILSLVLASAAVLLRTQEKSWDRVVWFWAACAGIAFFLALGRNLPFGIHRLLHQLPVYGLFRASARHLFEFTFAVGILAGMGVTRLTQVEQRKSRRALLVSIIPVLILMGAALISLRYFARNLLKLMPSYAEAHLLTLPEVYISLSLLGLSLITLGIYWHRQNRVTGVLLVAVLFLDLMSFGFFYEWNTFNVNVKEQLSDSPTVKFIKEREGDLNSMRIVSRSSDPWGVNSRLLDYPNISIARGLQSVNGYDPLRLIRTSEIAGNMQAGGEISSATVFNSDHQGLNLLNVKYLLSENRRADEDSKKMEIEGVTFSRESINLRLTPGEFSRLPSNKWATGLAIISFMEGASGLADGTPVVKITLETADGRKIEREMQAGRDTADWSYDLEKLQGKVKHARPQIAENWPGKGFSGHRYLARIPFDRAEIRTVDLKFIPQGADITIGQISLYDEETKSSEPLMNLDLPADRWRKLARFGEVELYENLKALPRAWFVGSASVASTKEVLQTIKSGRLMNGAPFNPAETVLFEKEDFGNREINLPVVGDHARAEVKITRFESQRIHLQTVNPQPGFLVLSEIYYPGWEARVDGQHTSIYRVNYVFRGIEVPSGEHHVEFVYRSHSFRNGATYALLGIALLFVGAFLKMYSGLLVR